jgi:hypothetical protein
MVSECEIPAAQLLTEKPDKALARPGVYAIYCDAEDRYYVGSSQDIRCRIWSHRSALRRNEYHNRRTLRCYVKNGEKRFLYKALEFCLVSELREKEEHWIAALDSCGDNGLNVISDARGSPGDPGEALRNACAAAGKKSGKPFCFISPTGEIHSGKNISDFCEKHGLNKGSMGAVLDGRLVSSSGWTKPNARKRMQSNVRNYDVISPWGERFIGENRVQFSMKMGLGRQRFSYLCTGRYKQYKGWRKSPCT